MIPLIIIIALVVAGIALILIDKKKQRDGLMRSYAEQVKSAQSRATELQVTESPHRYFTVGYEPLKFECPSLAHPADPVTFRHHKKPVKKANKKRVTIRKKQVKNGKVPKVRKPR